MALYIPHSIFHLARLLYVRPETFWPYYVCMYMYIALFGDCVSCWDHYCASERWMIEGTLVQWYWQGERPKCWYRDLSEYHYVDHKSYVGWAGTKPGSPLNNIHMDFVGHALVRMVSVILGKSVLGWTAGGTSNWYLYQHGQRNRVT